MVVALSAFTFGGRRTLHGLVAGLDGTPMLRASILVGADVREAAVALAAQLKDAGAAAILAEARAITTASHEQKA